MKKQIVSWVINSIIAGLFLVIGCMVNLVTETKPLGAFLFSLGLFSIIRFEFGLYTGKAGYMAVEPPSYIAEVFVALLGNGVGACIGGWLVNLTRFGDAVSQGAANVMASKINDTPLSIFILAVFCGILMYTAVEGNRKCIKENNHIGALFSVVIPVMVFILCGFNHCVADMAYFSLSRFAYPEGALLYFVLAISGNAVGCMLIPLLKKWIQQ